MMEEIKNKVIIMIANVDWIFIAHRLPIAKEAIRRGFRVVVVASDTGESDKIKKEGIEFINLPISRSGVNPITEALLLCKFFFLYKKLKPSVVYQVTMKPVIYGTLVSKLLGIKTVNAISGLGYNFTGERKGFVQRQMIRLMRFGFSKKDNALIFENKDDLKELKELEIVTNQNNVTIVKGVGVDLKIYKYVPAFKKEKIVVLLATRMLWDKGVKEFIEAAKLLKESYQGKVFFKLCGRIDEGNLEAVPEQYLRDNKVDNYLEWFGHKDDIAEEYRKSDIVVLPSYREGMPTVLIEASAIGRPLITTISIGCRECVEEGKNGYKVPMKSIALLAEAIEKLINSPEDRERMGRYSRSKAENEFDQIEVINKHLAICEELIGKR